MVRGYKGTAIDCMFFPSISEDNIDINVENPKGEYLKKPTFILCNPNALIY